MPAKPPRSGPAGAPWGAARRALLGAVLPAAALLLIVHGLGWLWLTAQLEEGFAAWAAARRAEGWQVAHGPPARGGWPWAASLHLPGLSLEDGLAGRPGGLAWRAEDGVRLSLAAARPERLEVALAGRHGLRLGEGRAMPGQAGRLSLLLPVAGLRQAAAEGLPREAAVEAAFLTLGTAAGPLSLRSAAGSLASEAATPAVTDGGAKGSAHPARRLSLALEALRLPPGLADAPAIAVLGTEIREAALTVLLSGPVAAPGTGRPRPATDPGALARRLAAWRDHGGALDLSALHLRWGPADLRLAARLTLDAALLPAGEGRLLLVGAREVIAAAGAAGALPPQGVAAARGLLPLLQRTPPGGGPPVIEAPIRLAGGGLAVAGFPLLRLPRPPWGTAGP